MGFDGKEIKYYDLAWEFDKSNSDYELNRIRGAEYILMKPKADINTPCHINLYMAEEMWHLTIMNGLLLAGITLLVCYLTCGKIQSRIKVYFQKNDDRHQRVSEAAVLPSEPRGIDISRIQQQSTLNNSLN